MFCQKCGQQMQDDWVLCPKCGTKANTPAHDQPSSSISKSESSFSGPQLIKGVIAFIVAIVLFAQCSGPSPKKIDTSPTPPSKKQILVAAKVDTQNILVYNGNDFDWISPQITIWDGNDGYRISAETIKAKEQKIFRLSDFVRGTNRFDGRKLKPDKITISTDTAGGGMQLQ